MGRAVSFPSGVWAEPQQKLNLVHFNLKMWYLMAPVWLIFLRISWPQCMPSMLHWSKKWLDGVQPWKQVPGRRPWLSTHTVSTDWLISQSVSRTIDELSCYCWMLFVTMFYFHSYLCVSTASSRPQQLTLCHGRHLGAAECTDLPAGPDMVGQ